MSKFLFDNSAADDVADADDDTDDTIAVTNLDVFFENSRAKNYF